METHLDKIMSEAMELPASSRAFLVGKLIDSLDPNGATKLSDEWKVEVRSRCRESDKEAVHLVDVEEAFAKGYERAAWSL